MLADKHPIEFPLAGSTGYLRPGGEPVTVLQGCSDGRLFLARQGYLRDAQRNFRAERDEVFATPEQARGKRCQTCRGTGKRRRKAAGAIITDRCKPCAGTGRRFE